MTKNIRGILKTLAIGTFFIAFVVSAQTTFRSPISLSENVDEPLKANETAQTRAGALHLLGGATASAGVVDALSTTIAVYTDSYHAREYCLDVNNTPLNRDDDVCKAAWTAANCSANGTYQWSNNNIDGTTCSASATNVSVANGAYHTLQDSSGDDTGSVRLNCDNGTITESNASCSTSSPPPSPGPTNGSCGSAQGTTVASYPSGTAACSAGTQSTVDSTGTDGSYNWQCTGSGGGTTATCSATRGQCSVPSTKTWSGAGGSCTGNTSATSVWYGGTVQYTKNHAQCNNTYYQQCIIPSDSSRTFGDATYRCDNGTLTYLSGSCSLMSSAEYQDWCGACGPAR